MRARRFPARSPERRPGDAVETFPILTTEANDTMRALHHRMPVILSPKAFMTWLAGEDVRLGPAPEDLLAMHRVSLQPSRRRPEVCGRACGRVEFCVKERQECVGD